jgi:[ribosomal protein S5]-alanine N-acetyltransferase
MILATDRLLLREFLTQDCHAVLAYQADPRFLRSTPWTHRLREDVERLVQEFIGWQHEQPRCKYQLAIVLQTTHVLIGTCGIRKATAHAQEAELGYELHPDYWGHGYATETTRTMLAFAFQTLRLQRVWAQCRAENTASVRVLERLGMRQERCQRPQHTWMQHRRWDHVVYTIDRAEWQEQMETKE